MKKATKSRTIIVLGGYSRYYGAYVRGAQTCKLSVYADYVADLRAEGYDDARIAAHLLDELDRYGNRLGGLIVLQRGRIE